MKIKRIGKNNKISVIDIDSDEIEIEGIGEDPKHSKIKVGEEEYLIDMSVNELLKALTADIKIQKHKIAMAKKAPAKLDFWGKRKQKLAAKKEQQEMEKNSTEDDPRKLDFWGKRKLKLAQKEEALKELA